MSSQNKKILAGLSVIPPVLLAVFLYNIVGMAEVPAKNARQDPVVIEALGQARALQKQGALSEAFIVYENYALQGYPEAMFYAAKAYSKGWGIDPNLDKARHFLLLAVQYGFSFRGESAYELGRLFQRSQGKDCNTIAVEWFKKAMDWRFSRAALQLAIHYEKGLGVDQDFKEAVYYYERAITTGNEQAHLKFARLLKDGKYGLRVDPERAQDLTSQALIQLDRKATAGSPSAAKQLGRLYRKGALVEQDLDMAEKWLRRAAYLGSNGGMHDLARLLLSNPTAEQQPQDAIFWLRKAAENGHSGAMTSLGRFHLEQKYGLPKQGAVHWFDRGVAAGHGGSMEELARLYETGDLVEKDREAALRLAGLGSRLGHSGSQSFLKELEASMASNTKSSDFVVKEGEYR
ncbi:MAG: tetratricopeptide repeat protein [Sneathiella sp.]|uniref:tetratricopeptide repeat protein n=1 Tax=Sneathiella sp. TaxID=1964365 RepID=UPI0030022212